MCFVIHSKQFPCKGHLAVHVHLSFNFFPFLIKHLLFLYFIGIIISITSPTPPFKWSFSLLDISMESPIIS